MLIKALMALPIVFMLIFVYLYTARKTRNLNDQWASCLKQSVSVSCSNKLTLAGVEVDRNTEYPFGEVVKRICLTDDIRIKV